MTVLEVLQVVYFFGPAYAADVSPLFARELLPKLTAPLDGGLSLASTVPIFAVDSSVASQAVVDASRGRRYKVAAWTFRISALKRSSHWSL